MSHTFVRPELELKRRAPLVGGQPGTHEFRRTATVMVGPYDTCDYQTDGVADNLDLQAAINDFPDGAHIYCDGQLNFANNILFDQGLPAQKEWMIEGGGIGRSYIYQPTANKDAIVIKNGTRVYLRNFRIRVTAAARYGISGDDTGADPSSWRRGGIENVTIDGGGAGNPLIYLKNAFHIVSHNLRLSPNAVGGIGMKLEQTDTVTIWGNNHFYGTIMDLNQGIGLDLVGGNAVGGVLTLFYMNFYGLNIWNSGASAGAIGIRMTGKVRHNYFSNLDIEAGQYGITGDSLSGLYTIEDNNFLNGYISADYPLYLGRRFGRSSFKNLLLANPDGAFPVIYDDGSQATGPNIFEDLDWYMTTSPITIGFGGVPIFKGRAGNGKYFTNRGIATILSGTSSIVVPHGIWCIGTITAPTIVKVTGRHSETAYCWVSARDAANITISVPINVTADRIVDWEANLL